MSENDNVIQIPSREPRGYPAADCNPNAPLPLPGQDIPSPEFAQLDLESLFNMREWVRDALEAKGAKCIGAGIGCGGALGLADVQIELDGNQYNIEIRPLPRASLT